MITELKRGMLSNHSVNSLYVKEGLYTERDLSLENSGEFYLCF